MSEVIKDSAIKLFGKTIALPFADKAAVSDDVSLSEQRHNSFATSTSQDTKDESRGDSTGMRDEFESMNSAEEKISSATSSETSDDPETAKNDESSDEKALKKPDKIIPCPRCSSMETKFCYYNNYNVNQPRHFCKNCQRYWTSGGTMRNVPVGSGRRKNKNALLPSYRHIVIPEARASDGNNGFLISPSGFPVTFYPAALYWGGSAVANVQLSSPTSILGKHSREGAAIRPSNLDAERSVLIPKTLRIHDSSEAAKSSIWTTLGIKNEKAGSFNGAGGLFKAFQSKGDRHSRVDHRAMVLQANPAAFSRSLNFHESV
ncbi:hypothetical protein C2S53_001923 [Perilla frutescens var. hirtella]|uniref:Dof-type domain-containing protein n=1 Tax=Perilla frutescens var. hirtella TaxID=608512 RepID=A0AAD4P2V4_PERFH|nr:hypothetical protein C2S53_001923 [Perilla frutescens var. hirtella]